MKLFFLLFIISTHTWAKIDKTINFITIDYCPLTCTDPNKPGIMVEIAKKIFESKGYNVKIKMITSITRAVKEVQQGRYDSLITGNKSHALGLVFPKTPALSHPIRFFSHKDLDWSFHSIQSLQDVELGVIKDFNYSNKEINEYIKKGKNVTQIGPDQPVLRSIKMMEKKRIDVWIAGEYVAKYHILKNGLSETIKSSSKVIGTYDNFISFSPKNPHAKKYSRIIDNGLKQFFKKKQMSLLLKKYGIE